MSLVLDSSVALTWNYADEGDEQTERVLQQLTRTEAWFRRSGGLKWLTVVSKG